jgi:hypothetical protein
MSDPYKDTIDKIFDKLSALVERTAKLEIGTQIRWNAHDSRSEALIKKIDKMTAQPMECQQRWQSYTNKQLALYIGIPTTIITVLSIILLFLRK